MRRTRRLTALALGAVATVALSACGGPSTTGTGRGGGGAGQAADANGVHNPSDATGGTLRMANQGDWDSLDPADTYYAYSWNFVRLYGRALVMFKSAPGKDGATLVPDLAENLGQGQRGREDLDLHAAPGREVRGRHARHEQRRQVRRRALAGQDDLPQRPHVLQRLPRPAGLHAPYKDTEPGQAGPDGGRDPGRPDDRLPPEQAVQRVRLPRPSPATIPVPQAKDTGRSTRSTWSPPARTCSRPTTRARASRWSATRTGTRRPTPTASRCPTGSRSRSTSTPTTSTTGCSPVTSTSTSSARGVQAAAQGKILADQTLKAQTDNPSSHG